MKISTKGRYGLRAFIDLACYGADRKIRKLFAGYIGIKIDMRRGKRNIRNRRLKIVSIKGEARFAHEEWLRTYVKRLTNGNRLF